MTTPPLDLPALRIDVVTASRFEIGSSSHPWSLVDPEHLVEAIDRAEAAERDLAAVTVSRDGWQTRAEAAAKAVAKVREITHRLHSEYRQADEVTESIDRADDIAHELDAALDNPTPETETTP
ncbi:hypothetical protein ACIGB6_10200 [Paeniglutamicibacter gangotriensis]|uniref:hypothetical protein n=1 Tax=Paeniglutamicibacter gangotriensis TaxID=254787 RepID=UPI0037CC389E